MKQVIIQLAIPEERISKLSLLKRFIRKKLLAEYCITQSREDKEQITHKSKQWNCQTDASKSTSSISS